MTRKTHGSPFAPHTDAETAAMLEAVGVESETELFDIPDPVALDDDFDIPARSEQAVRREFGRTLDRTDDLTEFLGRGHYAHYVPSLVDDISRRQEFLTSYTQYQPEIAQGFLQALFEYQSLLVELTGLDVANCSMYDAATALGEAATLSQRVRAVSGDRVLVPATLREGKRGTLEQYARGPDLRVDAYPTEAGTADVAGLRERLDDDVAMVYAETPTTCGAIEADLAAIGEAGVLGLGTAYGMGLGLFVTREESLRQVPGRLVGAGEDATGRRAYTLTLQTREQHIRKERATSNICTNQAWLALRAAVHAALLGPDGLVDLAEECVRLPRDLAARLDDISGVHAPVHDRHHFREFQARTDQPARAVAGDLEDEGYAVHVVGDHRIQVCVTDANAGAVDGFVAAMEEVA
ncbi:glycine dehydrogenase [Halobacteriales archaeon QH_1_68_42]|nr:MAG: glycine dehydrogenase [Halobacteriales archaeon QH_1_68_42]